MEIGSLDEIQSVKRKYKMKKSKKKLIYIFCEMNYGHVVCMTKVEIICIFKILNIFTLHILEILLSLEIFCRECSHAVYVKKLWTAWK